MFKKKELRKRKYHDGDGIEFHFRPNSLDIDGQDVSLTGVISGASYGDDGIRYNVQLIDKQRKIFGNVSIPEDMIDKKLED